MGDHTDYNDGFVLPVAIDRECLVAARRRRDGRVRVRSLDVDPAHAVVDVAADGSADPVAVEPVWGRYVAAVVRVLAEAGRPPTGIEAVVSSMVPAGAGLGSSAALEVACALALTDAAGFMLPREKLALACRDAEQLATGVPCGVMDQLASLAGEPGAALLIDCRSLEVEPVALSADVAVLVVHSGVSRRLAESAYAERRRACETIARGLGVPALRDARPEDVAEQPLARHVVSENARVLATAQALGAGDAAALGDLFAASHASLRDDYAVSTPELDALVGALVGAGALGARLTGAGFGGCVVALATRADVGRVAKEGCARYRAETGREPSAFVCEAVAGAGRCS